MKKIQTDDTDFMEKSLEAKIKGIIPPLVTPLDRKGRVDEESLEKLISHCIQGGVSALFILGSCGEGSVLTDLQKKTAVRCA